MNYPKNLKELIQSGYEPKSVKMEIRDNLIEKIKNGQKVFPEIVGFDETVIPKIENAILSCQDIILLGERGQAKTKIMRSFVTLLDPFVPAVAGCVINCDPKNPLCKRCKKLIKEEGGSTPISWIPARDRYHEKLATPDTSIADLIGDIDPIKVAEGRYLTDEETIHFGLIPRSNRGIFAINELPELPEKVQVGLFNILQEKDVQIRGFSVRFPLNVYIIASANPEDYTNRGKIITPLKDRFGSQIRTHYPLTRDYEIQIMEAERVRIPEEDKLHIPYFMLEIVSEMTRQARKNPKIDQSSGVSVRVSISNLENLISNATRRYYMLKDEEEIVPRISDLHSLFSSTTGKIELLGFEQELLDEIIEEILGKAILTIFSEKLGDLDFSLFIEALRKRGGVFVGDMMPKDYYKDLVSKFRELDISNIEKKLGLGEGDKMLASVFEFILEGLYQKGDLEKEEVEGNIKYTKRGTS